MITIRWRVILEPVCWLLGHIWYGVAAGDAFSDSGYTCTRCARWASLQRCICGHRDWQHQSLVDPRRSGWAYCRECECPAYVSEAQASGAMPPPSNDRPSPTAGANRRDVSTRATRKAGIRDREEGSYASGND